MTHLHQTNRKNIFAKYVKPITKMSY